jgi:hypothetical protein
VQTSQEKQYDIVIKFTERYQKEISYLYKASQGYTYLIVTLEIHNNVNRTFDSDPDNFYVVVNSIKYARDYATYDLPDALKPLEVLEGGTLSGSIAFEVPETTTDYTLGYSALFTVFEINWVHYANPTTQQTATQLIQGTISFLFPGNAVP